MKPSLLKHSGERRHRGAANANQVNVFRVCHYCLTDHNHHQNDNKFAQQVIQPLIAGFENLQADSVVLSPIVCARTPKGRVMFPNVT